MTFVIPLISLLLLCAPPVAGEKCPVMEEFLEARRQLRDRRRLPAKSEKGAPVPSSSPTSIRKVKSRRTKRHRGQRSWPSWPRHSKGNFEVEDHVVIGNLQRDINGSVQNLQNKTGTLIKWHEKRGQWTVKLEGVYVLCKRCKHKRLAQTVFEPRRMKMSCKKCNGTGKVSALIDVSPKTNIKLLLEIGDEVEAEHFRTQKWYPAKVVATAATDYNMTITVKFDQSRCPFLMDAYGKKYLNDIRKKGRFKIGDKIEYKRDVDNQWYPATVIATNDAEWQRDWQGYPYPKNTFVDNGIAAQGPREGNRPGMETTVFLRSHEFRKARLSIPEEL